MTCRTGKHEWTDPADAAKCCNGWHRELRTGIFDGKCWYTHVWVSDDEPRREEAVKVVASTLAWMLIAWLSVSGVAFAQIGPDAAVRDALAWDEHQRVADWISTGLVAAALVLPCAQTRTWRCVRDEALQVGIGVGVAEITKRVTHRRRPNGTDRLSFFSSHTMLACLGTVRRKSWAICPAVGYLRIASDWHWSTDVAAGGLVGAALTTIAWGR